MLLTVELGILSDGNLSEEVEIYFDAEGLDYLMARLKQIQDGGTDHLHLMSETWGLGDLTEELQRKDNLLAHHLRFTLVGDGKTQ